MIHSHPNITLLERVDIANLSACADLFHPDAVWHFFNTDMPELHGDYSGFGEILRFFDTLQRQTGGTFAVEPREARAIGEELVVVQTRNRLKLGAQRIAFDVAVLWRIVDGKIAEVWDIPALHSAEPLAP
ncbi:nuclear transport factor 2 family protein [Aestuariivita sp.]|jgi:ketosteroid isomerase-like protein|uniref:nuclear transport factor 2 family protein n=1 Tax=Aestuariivita sp. TaxID=1872407 RepID=UPI00217303D8|nr:nuclear transport factor 2 family protein [Aestuariivita sp.]MCE8006845.1 nuclear transport factor 2 family protein [Aestuariivita sp.]